MCYRRNRNNSIIFRFLATCDSDKEYDVKIRKFFTKTFPVILIISIPCVVFIPTTKEALVIYAVGGGLDYIKSDTTMQQMPKKVIDACDAYLDEILKDSNNKKDK